MSPCTQLTTHSDSNNAYCWHHSGTLYFSPGQEEGVGVLAMKNTWPTSIKGHSHHNPAMVLMQPSMGREQRLPLPGPVETDRGERC